MSYRAGGFLAGCADPRVRCDGPGCEEIVTLDEPVPAWFLAGKAPPGWSIRRIDVDGNHARLDYCPQHSGGDR